jgi:para-nitrobenzyl esterase
MYETFAAGKQSDVPILIGYNANEGGDILDSPLSAGSYIDGVKSEYGGLSAKILDLYPAGSDEEAARSQLALLRDNWFGWHMWSWARLQSGTGHGAVYFYNFSYVPDYPPGSPLAAMGAAHGFELRDVFAHGASKATAKDQQMLEAISTYWNNFAKTGNPNGPGLAKWPAFTPGHQMVMTLGNPIAAAEISVDDLRRLELLDVFFVGQRGSQ